MPALRPLRLLFVVVSFAIGLAALPGVPTVAAESALVASSPVAGEIVPLPPAEIVLQFTPERAATATVRLLDQRAQDVAGIVVTRRDDGAVVLTPATERPLAAGTYSAVWEAGGERGYVPFTIGPVATIRAASIPVADDAGGGGWVRAAGRWAGLVGAGLLAAWWPAWALIVRPRTTSRRTLTALARANVRVAPVVAIAAVAGSALEILARVVADRSGASLGATLLDTRDGERLLVRVALATMLALASFVLPWLDPRGAPWRSAAAGALSLALAAAVTLDGHAGAGEPLAVVALGTLHVGAAWLWLGGAVLVLVWFALAAGAGGREAVREATGPATRRLLALGVGVASLLVVSGLLLGLPLAGGFEVVGATGYGMLLVAKSALALALLAIAAGRLLRRGPGRLAVDVTLLATIVAASAGLSATTPGREELAARQPAVTASLAGDAVASVGLAPGGPGPNHLAVTVAGAPLPSDARLSLTLALPPAGLGPVEVRMVRGAGNTFEAHGSEISAGGPWTLVATLERPGAAPVAMAGTVVVPAAVPAAPALADPLDLTWRALAGVALLVVGAVVLAALVAASGARREQSLIAIGAYAVGLLLILQARVPAEPVSLRATLDPALVAAGEPIYAAQCASCHGMTGMGDGALAGSLPYPPADFTSPAHQGHSAAALATWVRVGIADRGMPAFGDTLTNGEIAAVVAYVQWLGATGGNAGAIASPVATPVVTP